MEWNGFVYEESGTGGVAKVHRKGFCSFNLEFSPTGTATAKGIIYHMEETTCPLSGQRQVETTKAAPAVVLQQLAKQVNSPSVTLAWNVSS